MSDDAGRGTRGGALRQLQENGAAPPAPHHTLATCCPWRGSHTCFAQCSCPLRHEVANHPLTMLLRPANLLRGAGLSLWRPHPPHTTLGCWREKRHEEGRIGLSCDDGGDDNDSGDGGGGDDVVEVW